MLVFNLGNSPVILDNDSHDYLRFSESILSGSIFERSQGQPIEYSLAVRTPSYPLILAATEAAFGPNPSNVVFTHILLGALCLGICLLLASNKFEGLIFGLCSLLALAMASDTAKHVLTEWPTLCFILPTLAALARAEQRPSTATVALATLLSSLLILMRPAMLSLLAPLCFLGLVLARRHHLSLLIGSTIGFLPILFWLMFNFYRLGVFTLTPFGGVNLFGVTSLAGWCNPSLVKGDPAFSQFVANVNAKKFPPPGTSLKSEEISETGFVGHLYNVNIQNAGLKLEARQLVDIQSINHHMMSYSICVIRQHPLKYLEFVTLNFQRWSTDLWISLAMIVLGLLMFSNVQKRSLATMHVLAGSLHIAHLAICSLIEITLPRYRNLTFPIIVAVLIYSLIVVAYQILGSSRADEPTR